jgi:uroporphyrinogen-III synthase
VAHAGTLVASLGGRVILVTRPRPESGEIVDLLRAKGAKVLLAPAIGIAAVRGGRLEGALEGALAGEFAWVVFTSQAGVAAAVERLRERGLGLSGLRAKVAAVGEGTAGALREAGIEPDLVPSTYTTEALGRAMPKGSGLVLLPRADIAPEKLDKSLEAKGWTPVRVDAYRTTLSRRMPAPAERAIRAGEVDAVTFTSASTVDGFMRMAAPLKEDGIPLPRAVSIGPVTTRTAVRAGLQVAGEANPHTIKGLVLALERALAARPRPGVKRP